MSDPNEPPTPSGGHDAPAPPPPPPSDPYGGAAAGSGGYGGGAGGAGGYGAPPENPYGQPSPSGYSPTDAIGYGWRKFTAKPGQLLVPMIVVWVVLLIVGGLIDLLVYRTLLNSHSCNEVVLGSTVHASCGPGFVTRLFGTALISAIFGVVINIAAAGLYKGATHVTDGKPFSLGQMFDGWDKTQVVIAALLVAVATAIGSFLCYIPGLIVGFLTMFTMLFVVDKQLDAVSAIKASVKLVTDNLGSTLLFYLLGAVVLLVGACLCGVGLLVAAPVVLVGLAYTYRRLQNEPVVT
jgi:uncharacterized membrane protein